MFPSHDRRGEGELDEATEQVRGDGVDAFGEGGLRDIWFYRYIYRLSYNVEHFTQDGVIDGVLTKDGVQSWVG